MKNPFSVGITLEELSAVSCDLEWNEAFIHEQTGVIRKVRQRFCRHVLCSFASVIHMGFLEVISTGESRHLL